MKMITDPFDCGRSNSGQRNPAPAQVAEHTFDVFFYGLNMDADLLSSKGVVPRNPRAAWLEDHVVVLGAKAMLLRSHGKRAYGMLYRLTHREMDVLYTGLHDYSLEPFMATLADSNAVARHVAAIGMVHRAPPVDSNRDPTYFARWTNLVQRLRFPDGASTDTD